MTNGDGLYASKIRIVGEFNNWDKKAKPMRTPKKGVFIQEVELETNQEYQFRYLVDDIFWENEPQADGLVPSGVDVEDYNSIIVV